MREDTHRDTEKKNGTRKTRKKRNSHLVVHEINEVLMWY